MFYEIKILGCGGSTGVPDLEKGFGNCDHENPKNYRTRTSALLSIKNLNSEPTFKVQSNLCSLESSLNLTKNKNFYDALSVKKAQLSAKKNKVGDSIDNNTDLWSDNESYNILFDVSPDFRQQAISNNISNIDTILFTHFHADHIYGIDDLRSINRIMGKPISCYANQETTNAIKNSFSYVFNGGGSSTSNGVFYKPSLDFKVIKYDEKIKISRNIEVVTTKQHHGRIDTVGFVINNKVGYATDFVTLPQQTIEAYKNLDILIVSAFTINPHVSHMHLEAILQLLDVIKPKLTILTHMGIAMDYDNLLKILPKNILPAYDGMLINNSYRT